METEFLNLVFVTNAFRPIFEEHISLTVFKNSYYYILFVSLTGKNFIKMKRLFHIALLVASITLTAQLTISPLAHNHPLDFKDHFDCPAYVISTTLLSFFVFFFIGFLLKSPLLYTVKTTRRSRKNSAAFFCRLFNKAPPQFSVL